MLVRVPAWSWRRSAQMEVGDDERGGPWGSTSLLGRASLRQSPLLSRGTRLIQTSGSLNYPDNRAPRNKSLNLLERSELSANVGGVNIINSFEGFVERVLF